LAALRVAEQQVATALDLQQKSGRNLVGLLRRPNTMRLRLQLV